MGEGGGWGGGGEEVWRTEARLGESASREILKPQTRNPIRGLDFRGFKGFGV